MLYELNNHLEYASDRLSKLSCSVDSYLKGVLEELERQVGLLEALLEDAKKEYNNAEGALRHCHSIDPPVSCVNEESRLSRAIAEVRRCESNLKRGKQLFVEIRTHIEAYNSTFNFLTWSGGGKELIDHLAGEHTEMALKELRKIISLMERYLAVSIGGKGATTHSGHSEGTLVYATGDHRSIERIREDVKEEQREFNDYHRVSDASRVMVCPDCHRPIPVCICGNKNVNAKIYRKDD